MLAPMLASRMIEPRSREQSASIQVSYHKYPARDGVEENIDETSFRDRHPSDA